MFFIIYFYTTMQLQQRMTTNHAFSNVEELVEVAKIRIPVRL